MTALLSIVLWLPVIAAKAVLALLGIVIVPWGVWSGSVPWLYQADDNRPWTVWEMLVRNPVNNMKHLLSHPDEYTTRTNLGGVQMEAQPMIDNDMRFAWRWRRSNILSSIRLVWVYNETRYGELYLGWKLGSAPPALDFAIQPFRWWAKVGN